MSFNRLNYDPEAYKQSMLQSKGPGKYRLTDNIYASKQCYTNNPNIRLQKQGNSIDKTKLVIDIDSELHGLFKRNSKDYNKNYISCCPNNVCNGNINSQYPNNLNQSENCNMIVNEYTRLSNPSCNLRCKGWNRWEWLCLNPQNNIEIPFNYNISNRIIVKDNHRACIPKPISVELSLPKNYNNFNKIVNNEKLCSNVSANFTQPKSINWENCQ